MGSNDNTTTTICKPFSLRKYVFEARQKDVRPNWPFPDKYLQVCVKHGITRMLPPFESRDPVKNRLSKVVGSDFSHHDKSHFCSNNKSSVEIGGEGKVVKVKNEHGEDTGLNYDVVLHPMASKVHISATNLNFNFHADLTSLDQCLSAMPFTKRSACKRKKLKGKVKKRSILDIYANARSCTLEDLDKLNGSNWDVYLGDQSAIKK